MLERFALALFAEAVVVTTGVTTVVTTTWEVLVPETRFEVVTSVVGEEVVTTVEEEEEEVVEVVVGVLEVEVVEVDDGVKVEVGVDAIGSGRRFEVANRVSKEIAFERGARQKRRREDKDGWRPLELPVGASAV